MPTLAIVLVSKADWSHAQPKIHRDAPNDGLPDSFPLAASDFSNMLVDGTNVALLTSATPSAKTLCALRPMWKRLRHLDA